MKSGAITRDALRSYVAQSLDDKDLIALIERERKITGSWVQRTLQELYGKLADPLSVDWAAIALRENVEEGVTQSMSDFLGYADGLMPVSIHREETKPRRRFVRRRYRAYKYIAAVTILALLLVVVGLVASKLRGHVVVAKLVDGDGTITVDRSGKIAGLDGVPREALPGIERMLTTRSLPRSEDRDRLVAFRGGKSPAYGDLVSPIDTAVLTDHPTFIWNTPSMKDTRFTVRLFVVDSSGRLDISASPPPSDILTTTAYVWHSSVPSGIYSWDVVITRGGVEQTTPPTGSRRPRFRVLDRETAKTIETTWENHREAHVFMTYLFCQYGLLEHAEKEARALLANNPESEVARDIFLRVQDLWNPKPSGAER
jgi:hypothetical protein